MAENINANANGGIINQYGNEYIVRGITRTTDPAEIGKSVIRVENGYPIKVEDVATVAIGAYNRVDR